ETSAGQGTVASGGSSNPATLSSFGGAMGARGIPASNRRRRSADRLGSVGGGKSAISTASRWESFDLNVEYQLCRGKCQQHNVFMWGVNFAFRTASGNAVDDRRKFFRAGRLDGSRKATLARGHGRSFRVHRL